MNERDQDTAARHQSIWAQFRRNPSVTPWTGRAALPPEVTATLGFVIPIDDPAVCDALQRVVDRLQASGCVDAFPPGYWHITIVPPALLTDGDPKPPLLPASFAPEALDSARSAVRGLGPVDLAVRGLNAFRDVVVAVPYDGGRGLELGRTLRAAMPPLPERYPDGHQPLPHISLAQYRREDRLEELLELIEQHRQTDFGCFRARRLAMFVLPWRDGVPGTVEKHEIPLEGQL